VQQTALIQAFLRSLPPIFEVRAVFSNGIPDAYTSSVRCTMMKNKALLILKAALLLLGMLTFQACFEEEPYRYAPEYGHPYEYPTYRYGGGYGYHEPFWGNHEEHEEHERRWHDEDDD
jgi:hypothetical protein